MRIEWECNQPMNSVVAGDHWVYSGDLGPAESVQINLEFAASVAGFGLQPYTIMVAACLGLMKYTDII